MQLGLCRFLTRQLVEGEARGEGRNSNTLSSIHMHRNYMSVAFVSRRSLSASKPALLHFSDVNRPNSSTTLWYAGQSIGFGRTS